MTWSTTRIQHLANEVTESVDPTTYGDDLVAHFSIPALDATGGPEIQPASEIQSAKQPLRGGEVLISRLNPRKARVLTVPHALEYPALGSGEFIVLDPHPRVEPRFLEYVLLAESTRQFLDGAVQSVTRSHQRIRPEQLLKYEVAMPGLDEQRAIADHLDAETARIDALIAKKQQLIHLLEERWVAQRDASILRGVDPVSGTGQLPEGWARPQLGVVIELQRGHDLPSDARQDGPFPVVSSGGISGYHDEWACRGPAVVTGRYGTVGEVYFVEEDCWPLNTTLYVKDFRGNDPRWVAFLLESLPLDAESEKSAVGGINRNVIGKLRVPRPGLDVQQRVAERLTRARATKENTREVLDRQLKLLAEHRQALITAAVTGDLIV